MASEREPKASRGIDPTTLWMGISGGVVFVAVVFSMLYLVFGTPGTNAPEKQSTVASENTAPAPELPKVPAANPAGVPAAPKATEKPKEVAKESVKSLSRERRNEIDAAIADAKAELNPHDGLKILENLKTELEGKHFEPPENLLQAIGQMEEAAKQAPKSTGTDSSSPLAAEPEKDAATETENTEAPEPKEDGESKKDSGSKEETESGDGK